ncbi:hypothetical protein RJ639_029683 [Escallonia herrerae]|uniref:Uncharacterized protein n=1 Tax=Escallonia herrerae TaxID=1293975 RepID=A0AA88X072_9ASTE|nr:hypothetical protein RJ639_029683 [Escallonia herrerae]
MKIPEFYSSNLHFNGLGLLGLPRRQLLDGHRQHPVLTDCRNGLDVGILRQHELPHELADPPLHPHVLGRPLLFLSLPLPTDHQDAVVLHLHLDITRFQPRHVDYEHVGIRVLLHIGGCRSHGLGVAKVGNIMHDKKLKTVFQGPEIASFSLTTSSAGCKLAGSMFPLRWHGPNPGP